MEVVFLYKSYKCNLIKIKLVFFKIDVDFGIDWYFVCKIIFDIMGVFKYLVEVICL